jgi:molecular chaperone DnaK (HSP70)
MRHFGIDLGTSTCSVSYAVNSARPNYVPQPAVVEFRMNSQLGTKSAAVPSVVARKGKGDAAGIVYGFEAEEAVREGQVTGRNFHTIFRSVKSHLGTGRSYVWADPSLNTPVKVWGALIRRLCEMTIEEKGADFDPRKHPAVLTVPASFGRAQRDDTLAAAKLAGFEVNTPGQVQLIDEPVAALIDALNHPDMDLSVDPTGWNSVLVFDFGGGTCDLVVLKMRYDATKPGGLEVQPQSISPYQQIGGDTIDLAIMEQVVWPQVCKQLQLSREELAATERKQIEDALRYQVCRQVKILVNEKLQKLPVVDFRAGKWAGVSDEVSMAGHCRVGKKEIIGTARLTADELSEVITPFLELDTEGEPFRVGESPDCYPFATLVEQTLERAGMTSEELDLVVLHGGSCHSPFLPRLFERMREEGILKAACKVIRTPDLITSVARGAALYGCLSAKHGKPYIPPIVPEDLSILTEGGSCEVLVHAGTQLPVTKTFSGKKQFYLSKNGQREITLPIYIGYDDRRRRASTLTIPIKQARLQQSHPVEVELAINEDKISRWRCRPVGFGWCDAIDVANPWIGEEPSEQVENLQKQREVIRATLEKGAKPKVWALVEEALTVARAGLKEEGLQLIEDVLNDHKDDADGWNTKGLIHGMRDELEESALCYERAADLAPDKMVFRGNYGVALHRIKRHAEAVEVMRDALARDRALTYLHSWLAGAFSALNNHEEVKKELEQWHAYARQKTIRYPDDIQAWDEFALTATRLGRYDEAEEAFEQIRELKRDRNLLAGPGHG